MSAAVAAQVAVNHLKQSKNVKNIFNILNTTKLKKEKLIAWKLVGNEKVMADLSILVIRKFRNEIVFTPINNSMVKLNEILAGKEKINIFIPAASVLFQCKVKSSGVEDEGLVVVFPEMVAQVERRKDIRLPINEYQDVTTRFYKSALIQKLQTQLFTKQLYDISAGGCSIVGSKTEVKYFSVGDTITDMVINLEGTNITADVKVVSLIPINPDENNNLVYKGFKICFQYINLSHELKEMINSFVFKYVHFDE